jgi:flagellin-specific chaperone FliS
MIGTRENLTGAAAYRVMEGVGAAPEDYLKMGLDAARMLLLRAEMALRAGDRVEKAKALASAGRVVEFMLGLSGTAPGALSDCLASVYQYALAAIVKGNAGDDIEAVAAGRTALEELANTWRKIFPDALAWAEPGDDAALSRRGDHA